jgi:hypothetical protein
MKVFIKEFMQYLFPSDSFRQKLALNIIVKLLALAAVGGVWWLTTLLINWTALQSVEMQSGAPVAKASIVRITAGVVVINLAIFVVMVAAILFQNQRIGKFKMVPKPYEDLFRNVGKILDVAPAVRVTYKVDHKRFVISDTVDDFIEARYEIQTAEQPITYLSIEHFSSEPLDQIPLINARIRDGHAIDLPARFNKTTARWLVFFSPPAKAGDVLEYTVPWRNFWRPLRDDGHDYLDYRPSIEVKQSIIEFVCPAALGSIEWGEGQVALKEVRLDRKQEPNKVTLVAVIDNPVIAKNYHFDIRRLIPSKRA